ncbi:DUF6286 domain-containing protein [Streptomyces xinghaiensis]|uniref:DUF6286 domain-containing protein n=1 Tax=Streptomyces xinghaiensis TaxID=1038928 RepID=UPI003F4CF27B
MSEREPERGREPGPEPGPEPALGPRPAGDAGPSSSTAADGTAPDGTAPGGSSVAAGRGEGRPAGRADGGTGAGTAAGAGGGTGGGTGAGTGGQAAEQAAGHSGGRATHRLWSTRRVPAAIVALVAVAGTGLLLYDVAAVRAGGPAMRWRRVLADELATRPLDDRWVLAGAALAAAVGLWLLILAVTPGLRDLLPMRTPAGSGDVRAVLGRSAAALILRDRAMEVPGVQSARIRVRRRRVKARVTSHFREPDDIRADLDTALTDGVRELGLARRPSLSVSVHRPRKG